MAELPYPEIVSAAAGQLEFLRDRIRTYALAESPSGDTASLAACAELIRTAHAELGGVVQTEDGGHLITTWDGEDQTPVLLLGHYDTVWPVGQLERMPYVDDGETIAGPGTYDMKAGIAIVEGAIRVLRELGLERRRRTVLLLTSDEEVGSTGSRPVVERLAAEASCVLGFEPPHPRGVLKTGRRGSTRIRLAVQGREAHAALDRSDGVSAIDELLDQLQRVQDLLPTDGSVLPNIGTITGGTRANVIAGAAEAEIGLRFTRLDVEREVLGNLRGLTPVRDGADVTVQVLSNRPAWAAPTANPLLDEVAELGARLGQEVDGREAAGAGDSNFTGALGVPTLDGFGPIGKGAHALGESLSVGSLADRVALLAAYLARPS